MDRRNFLRNLFAAAVAPVAVAKAIQYQPVQLLKYPWYQLPMNHVVRDACVCSLTRTTINPITPEMLLSFANDFDTGMFRRDADKISFQVRGVTR